VRFRESGNTTRTYAVPKFNRSVRARAGVDFPVTAEGDVVYRRGVVFQFVGTGEARLRGDVIQPDNGIAGAYQKVLTGWMIIDAVNNMRILTNKHNGMIYKLVSFLSCSEAVYVCTHP
jgi:homospermidine synthase